MCQNAHAGCQGCPDNDEWRRSSVTAEGGAVPPDDETFPFPQRPVLTVMTPASAPALSPGDRPQGDPLDWCGQRTD